MLIDHKSSGMFGYASRTRAERVILENSSSGFKFQDVILNTSPNTLFG